MKRNYAFGIFLLCTLFLACKNSVQETVYSVENGAVVYCGEKDGNVITQIDSEPPSLHPTNSRTNYRDMILGLTFERVTTIDTKTGKILPQLGRVVSQSEDGLTYEYELDSLATWPDGTPITFKDVLFSTKAVACKLTEANNQRLYFDHLEDLIPNPDNPRAYTVKMKTFYQNNPAFGAIFYILDQRVYDPDQVVDQFTLKDFLTEGKSVLENPVLVAWANEYNDARFGKDLELLNTGSGPYMFDAWEAGQRIVLKKRAAYWAENKEGHIYANEPEQISYRILRDRNTIEAELKRENFDVASLNTESFQRLRGDSAFLANYRIEEIYRSTMAYMAINQRAARQDQVPFFKEAKVRLALAYATPMDEIIAQVFDTLVRRIHSPVPMHHPDYNQALEAIPYDPVQARQLLEEAGWKDEDGDGIREKMVGSKKVPMQFKLSYAANSERLTNMIQRIQLALAEVGIECVPTVVDFTTLRNSLLEHTFDAVLTGLSSPPTPFDFKEIFHSESWGVASNYGGYSSFKVDSLIDKARSEPNAEKRTDLVNLIQEILLEEQPMLLFYNPPYRIAVHKRFNGATAFPIPPYTLLNEFKVVRGENCQVAVAQ
ncbi:MAG: ABC transporter substrate-binding protein [Bacteroidota bacterium]